MDSSAAPSAALAAATVYEARANLQDQEFESEEVEE